MRLDPRLGWDDIDMRIEYVGARASYDNTIDRASDDVAKQVYKAKSKFVNALQTRCSRGRTTFEKPSALSIVNEEVHEELKILTRSTMTLLQ